MILMFQLAGTTLVADCENPSFLAKANASLILEFCPSQIVKKDRYGLAFATQITAQELDTEVNRLLALAKRSEMEDFIRLFIDWWTNHHENSRFFNECMTTCPTLAQRMQHWFTSAPPAHPTMTLMEFKGHVPWGEEPPDPDSILLGEWYITFDPTSQNSYLWDVSNKCWVLFSPS